MDSKSKVVMQLTENNDQQTQPYYTKYKHSRVDHLETLSL